MKKILVWLTVLWLMLSSTGCLSMSKSVTGMMDPMGNLTQVLADKIQSEGMLDKWLLNADAHFNNPRVVAGIVFEVKTIVGVEGTSGNVIAEGAGDSVRLDPAVVDALVEEMKNPNTSNERRNAIMMILGWNRTFEGGNDRASPGSGGP